MTTLSSGAVGFAPVGTFVKDLASELGKAPATLVAYLKKHLPDTLTKRKNANKRLANFVDSDGVQGLRAHYTPAAAPAAVDSELQRLREENARLRALLTDDPTESIDDIEQRMNGLYAKVEEVVEAREDAGTKRRSTIPDTRFAFPEPNAGNELLNECKQFEKQREKLDNELRRYERILNPRRNSTNSARVLEFKRKPRQET